MPLLPHTRAELTELAKPVERPCLCCNTHTHAAAPLSDARDSQQGENDASWPFNKSGASCGASSAAWVWRWLPDCGASKAGLAVL